jgi:MoaA/NifB/PqqE/SkfB family radical SAM enzyme
MTLRKHGCDLPFHHMAIRPDGQIFPCCYFRQEVVPKDLNISHPDPFNHPYLKYIRQQMREDAYVDGCVGCYKDEELSGSSMRTRMNQSWEFGLPFPPERGNTEKLTNIDLAFSNKCNNKCRMCGPDLSTHWYSDAKKLGYQIPRGVVAKNSIIENYDLTDLRFIKLIGGEPLMEQEQFIKILKKCNLPKLGILLVTNGSLVPNKELLDLLLQCENVSLHLSIDAYGSLNEFLRKDSVWKNVNSNLLWYKENLVSKIDKPFGIDSVCSFYNVNVLDKLIDYADSVEADLKIDMLDGPTWMAVKNLPDKVKPKIYDIITMQQQKYEYRNLSIWNKLLNELEQPGDFGMFVRNDAEFNKIRKEHWLTHNTELWNMIEPYIVPEIF